jgi:dATP pyrophosphohydrolase
MPDVKRPESVLVVIATPQNQVLMMERQEPQGFWQSVTGSLHWGESARHAAAREVYEETGIQAGAALQDLQHSERFLIVPPWRARYGEHARFNTEHWFLLRLPARRLIRLNPAEHRRYRWVDARQAQRMAFSWSNAKAVRLYCA